MHIPYKKEHHATEQPQQQIPENLTKPFITIPDQSGSIRIIDRVDG
jgi:hypothetical protein